MFSSHNYFHKFVIFYTTLINISNAANNDIFMVQIWIERSSFFLMYLIFGNIQIYTYYLKFVSFICDTTELVYFGRLHLVFDVVIPVLAVNNQRLQTWYLKGQITLVYQPYRFSISMLVPQNGFIIYLELYIVKYIEQRLQRCLETVWFVLLFLYLN